MSCNLHQIEELFNLSNSIEAQLLQKSLEKAQKSVFVMVISVYFVEIRFGHFPDFKILKINRVGKVNNEYQNIGSFL